MPDRALTILQLTHQGGGSGSTTIIANVSRQLARRGHRVLVGCRPGTMLAQLAWDAGLEVVALDFHRLGPLADALRETIAREEVRSEEHTSELQSQSNLVCRLLLEKKKETSRNVTSSRERYSQP